MKPNESKTRYLRALYTHCNKRLEQRVTLFLKPLRLQIQSSKKRHSATPEARHYLEGRFQWCWRPQPPTTKLRTPAMRQPVLSADPSSLFLLNSFHDFQRSHHVNSIASLSLQPNHPPVDNHCPLSRPRKEKKHVSQHEFLVIFPTTWQRGVRIPSVTCSLAVGSARYSTTLTANKFSAGKCSSAFVAPGVLRIGMLLDHSHARYRLPH